MKFTTTKSILIFLNLFFFLIGIALITLGALTIKEINHISISDVHTDPLSIGFICSGIFILILSIFGVIGTAKENKILISIYMFFLFLLIVVQIVFIVLVSNESKMELLFDHAWSKATNNEKTTFQNKFSCCGFQNVTDRPGEPCPSNVTSGCFSVIQKTIHDSMIYILIGVSIAGLIQFTLFSLCIILLYSISKQKEEERKKLLDDAYFINRSYS